MRGACSGPVLALAACAALALAPAARAGEATAFQQNAAHDGNSGEEALQPPLGRQWARHFDEGRVAGHALVAGGRVFALVAPGRVSSQGTASSLVALDAGDGRTLWSRELGGGAFNASMTYSGGRLFLVQGDGLVQALDPASGGPLWSRPLNTSTFSNPQPPVAAGGRLLVAARTSTTALEQATGLPVWTTGRGADGIPATDGDRLYLPKAACEVTALAVATGTELWRAAPSCAGNGYGTAVSGGRVWAWQGPAGAILDATLGSRLDSFPGERSPAFAGDVALVTSDGALTARDLATGVTRWRFDPGAEAFATSPVVAGSTVYQATTLGTLWAIRLSDGAPTWSRDVGDDLTTFSDPVPPRTGLAAGEGRLVVLAGELIVAYAPGPDAPGDAPGGAVPAPEFTLQARRRRVVYPNQVQLTGRFRSFARRAEAREFELQADRFPYDRYERVDDVELFSQTDRGGEFQESAYPTRNTRYRIAAVDRPGITSEEVTVLVELAGSFRVVLRRDRRLKLGLRLRGPADAGLPGRRGYVYRFRRRGRTGQRVAGFTLRGRGGRAHAGVVFRVRRLRRTDRFAVCVVEREDDGFGEFNAAARACGRRRARR